MYINIYGDLLGNGAIGFDVQFGKFHRSSSFGILGVAIVMGVAVTVVSSFWLF